jgi:hypothetical protein
MSICENRRAARSPLQNQSRDFVRTGLVLTVIAFALVMLLSAPAVMSRPSPDGHDYVQAGRHARPQKRMLKARPTLLAHPNEVTE